jgi:hypothetical protein
MSTPRPTLLVGFVDVDAAILALADGGVDISSEREHVSTTPASLSWPPKDQHKDILEDLRKADKRRILIVDARSWDAVQWKAADVTVVLFAETGRIELYILTDSMDQLPFLIRPSFTRVICSQCACAALASPHGGEYSLWLDYDTMKFTCN